MDVSWKHHAKWTKPITTNHRPYDLIYVKSPGQACLETQKVELVVAQGREDWGVGDDCQQGGEQKCSKISLHGG